MWSRSRRWHSGESKKPDEKGILMKTLRKSLYCVFDNFQKFAENKIFYIRTFFALNDNLNPPSSILKGQKNGTIFISGNGCLLKEKITFSTQFNVKEFLFGSSLQVEESLYKNFLQIKVKREGLNFHLAQIALENSQSSIFGKFLKMMKNAQVLVESFYQDHILVPDYSFSNDVSVFQFWDLEKRGGGKDVGWLKRKVHSLFMFFVSATLQNSTKLRAVFWQVVS